MHLAALDLRKGLSHFEAQVSHFSTGTAALFGRRLHTGPVLANGGRFDLKPMTAEGRFAP